MKKEQVPIEGSTAMKQGKVSTKKVLPNLLKYKYFTLLIINRKLKFSFLQLNCSLFFSLNSVKNILQNNLFHFNNFAFAITNKATKKEKYELNGNCFSRARKDEENEWNFMVEIFISAFSF